ncbi:MAG: CoA pyrophosphatase [Gemmatimonadota bacterium]|nr:CoA pyrophosphatase [Gemmatimonadota bacterium]
MSALQTRVAVDAPIHANSRLAAVLALVRIVDDAEGSDGSAELLFIKRADFTGDPWSGHIAFPGGRHDVIDESLAHTALRETREELALDVERHGKLIGRLDDLAPLARALPPITIRPFIGIVPPDVRFAPNDEVADAFWVPISVLQSPAVRGEYVITRADETSRFPAYNVGVRVIWGLTERIVTQLLPLFAREAPAG